MTMDEQRLRERLTGLANEIPPVGSAPPGLITKARRRAYVMPALALLCVIAAALVTFAGIRAVLGAQASVPAVPRPDRGAAREDHIIVVFDRSGRPGLAAAADADGEPAGYSVIRPSGDLWPLDRADDGRLAFTGFDRLTKKVSSASNPMSPLIVTLTVLLVSPGLNVSEPLVDW